MPAEKPTFLEALGVSQHRLTINQTEIVIHGLTNKQAAQLLESFSLLPQSAQTVVTLLNPTTNEDQQYFQTNYWKLGTAAHGWLSELLAASLRVELVEVEAIALENLPDLLAGIWEANKRFFTSASRLLETLQARVPAVGKLLQGLNGAEPSPPSSVAAGQS